MKAAHGILMVLPGLLMLLASCADRQAAGPTITLYESETIRRIPAGDFNEGEYLKRGYIKNTDPQGNTIYVFVPKQDFPEKPIFATMDVLNRYNGRDPNDRGGGGLNPGISY